MPLLKESTLELNLKLYPKYYKQYSHLFNKIEGWNKRGEGAKVAKSLNVEVGINVEGGIFWKKQYINLINLEWRVEKSKKSINV